MQGFALLVMEVSFSLGLDVPNALIFVVASGMNEFRCLEISRCSNGVLGQTAHDKYRLAVNT